MRTYTKEEVESATEEYFQGDKLASNVFITKYAMKNKSGDFVEKTPEDMHRRLAKEFARIEANYPNPLSEEEIFAHLDHFKEIVPQGSPMYGIGNNFVNVSLSNCVVIASPEDSVSSIMDTAKDTANLYKRRYGCGLDLSELRPEGSHVSNSAGSSTGAWSFADFFSNVGRMIGQGGRRAALMLTMDVRHPDIEKFITMKRDLTKVTGANISVKISDDFMESVRDDLDFTLTFPVGSKTPISTRTVKARNLWKMIVDAAVQTAEPGILMWDNILKNLPAQNYASKGFNTISTNPCLSGDTLVAVADGRNAVTIKQLAEENADIAIYSVNPIDGMISIKTARHPRITGYNKQLLRVTIDNGSYFDVTPDHKFMLRDGTPIEAHFLAKGDSLSAFKKALEPVVNGGKMYYRLYTNTRSSHKSKRFEHRMIAQFNDPDGWDKLYGNVKQVGFAKTGGLVIHHKDYDGLNNAPKNLEIMTFKAHQQLHASMDTAGEKNGRYSGVTNDEIKKCAMELTIQLGRRFSRKEWKPYAQSKNIPYAFSQWRIDALGDVLDMARTCAEELGINYGNVDPRIVRTYEKMTEQGYAAKIEENEVLVQKTCEGCRSNFWIEQGRREFSYCSVKCVSKYINTDKFVSARRVIGINKFAKEKGEKNKENQARIFSELRFKLGRDPKVKEWEYQCLMESVPYRYGLVLKHGFQTFTQIRDAGCNYNHKVVSIQYLPGLHTVYNLTVDDNHTVSIVHGTKDDTSGCVSYSGINVFQCGELPLSASDSCRLITLNLKSFVVSPFTSSASFDFERFISSVKHGMRLSDDLVDLELEKLSNMREISDAADEKALYTRLHDACSNGRRTGLGTHGLADALACLNLAYDSDEALVIIDKIYKTLRDNAYVESTELAKERGSFPVFEWELEKDNLFIRRLPEYIQQAIITNGRRNISLLTNAPTGSVSILSQTSSGIEPVFRNSYTRRRKLSHNEGNQESVFTDVVGDKWSEYRVYHHNVEEYLKLNHTTEIPAFFTESDKIDWKQRVKIQGVIQQYIDHALSSTINLPKGTSSDVVSELYMLGWKLGLKGITVYVDGSRDGVLITDKPDKTLEFDQHQAPKRPEKLDCDIHHVTIKGERWTVLVGLLNGKPYEIIGGENKLVELPRSEKKGVIVKTAITKTKARYDLVVGELIIKDVVSAFDNPNYSAFTRLLSLSLRHGAPINYVVEQMQKDETADMFSFSRSIARVLKGYVADGTKAKSQKTCPECSSTDLIYQDGCVTCSVCGWSRC